MIYITSDFHLNHVNISGEKESTWTEGYRDFNSVQEMNDAVIDSVNRTVLKSDTLYFLGDFAMGGNLQEEIPKLRERIKCETIHFIFGNHDKTLEKSPELQKQFTTCSYYAEIKYNKTKFCLFHFPLDVWNKHHHGAIHCHGHCHGNLTPTNRKRFDVGWDVFRKPVSLDEIIYLALDKEFEYKDHHK